MYAVMADLHQQGFPVTALSRALGASSSGYYAWLCGRGGSRAEEDRRLMPRVRKVFREHKRRYGARRIARELPEPDRVVQVIAKAGSAGVSRRDLIGEIELPWRLLDALLQQLVDLAQISAVRQDDDIVFRLVNPMLGVFDV